MDITSFFHAEIEEHQATVTATLAQLAVPFERLAQAAVRAIGDGHKIVFFGNGGSAADAQHLSTELVARYKRNRRPLPSIALTTDTSLLTAIGNDFSFDDVFERQVYGLCSAGDLAIGLSTSGNSPNVLKGLEAARAVGAVAAGLTGRDGGQMVGRADPLLVVPSAVTARIQEMHILLGHMLCDIIEQTA